MTTIQFLYSTIEFIKAFPSTARYMFSIQPMAGNFIKRYFLQKIIKKHTLDFFVEIGTFYGETSDYISKFVKKVVTIEIYEPLFQRANLKFKNNKNIKVTLGDSSNNLKDIEFKKNVLFFLDGHYSGDGTGKGAKEYPLFEELDVIKSLNIQNTVIVIDDFRLFGIDKHYPSLSEIEIKIKSLDEKYVIQIMHDMLYCCLGDNDND